MLETPILELIETIYAAALHVDLWPKALVRLADLTRSEIPALVLVRASAGRVTGIAPRIDPGAMRTYGEHWIHRNPLEQATRFCPALEITSPETVMGAGEFARTPIYNEWSRPSGLGTVELKTNLRFDNGVPTILNINRKHGADDYSSEEVAIFALAARHAARAVEVGRAVSDNAVGAEAMAAMLDERGECVILVDRRARILFATRRALALLKAGDALHTDGPAAAIAGRPGVLERLVASCHRIDRAHGGGGSVTIHRRGRRALGLTVAPFRPLPVDEAVGWCSAVPTAIITVTDPDARYERSLERWRARFGLTPSEARFALEIVSGGGRRAAARRFGISESTARTHLTSIFAKTGVSRQAELVALLLSGG
ncbi:MAG TPA: helix-turn-helix transcriptional regulator [Sphingomonas sp.]|nr:helix-turn-helix transcriptional regulator [Sphingomonas sp.]